MPRIVPVTQCVEQLNSEQENSSDSVMNATQRVTSDLYTHTLTAPLTLASHYTVSLLDPLELI